MKTSIDCEWNEAPIADDALRAVWGRFAWRVDNDYITRVRDKKSDSTRSAVYVSVFPLVEWLVENWWFVLYEASNRTEVEKLVKDSIREEASGADLNWLRRHSLLAAREGEAYPNVTLYRDGDWLAILSCSSSSFQDQDGELFDELPVEFLTSGVWRISVDEAKEVLSTFVDRVLARLREHLGVELSVHEEWRAIQSASQEEARLCRSAAKLGVDAYDPREFTESVEADLSEALSDVMSSIWHDFFDGTSLETLEQDLEWLRHVINEMPDGWEERCDSWNGRETPQETLAHEFGYRLARELREQTGTTDSITEIESLIEYSLDGSLKEVNGVSSDNFDAFSSRVDGGPTVVATSCGSETSRRFVKARAIFHTLPDAYTGPNVVSDSTNWQQRASRAFAAELLAPSGELVEQVSERKVDADDLQRLADHYGISALGIAHQLENHRIADVGEIY